jgi:hypothetical protein
MNAYLHTFRLDPADMRRVRTGLAGVSVWVDRDGWVLLDPEDGCEHDTHVPVEIHNVEWAAVVTHGGRVPPHTTLAAWEEARAALPPEGDPWKDELGYTHLNHLWVRLHTAHLQAAEADGEIITEAPVEVLPGVGYVIERGWESEGRGEDPSTGDWRIPSYYAWVQTIDDARWSEAVADAERWGEDAPDPTRRMRALDRTGYDTAEEAALVALLTARLGEHLGDLAHRLVSALDRSASPVEVGTAIHDTLAAAHAATPTPGETP